MYRTYIIGGDCYEYQKNFRAVDVIRATIALPDAGGLERAAKTVLQDSGKFTPWRVVTVSTDGDLLEE